MESVLFFDIEVNPGAGKISDYGGVFKESSFHSARQEEFLEFIRKGSYICAHNIINHDIPALEKYIPELDLSRYVFIDTLHLSPLLFPKKPYHSLIKDDKLQTDQINNPFQDAMATKRVFDDEMGAFYRMEEELQSIYCTLLGETKQFGGFFRYLNFDGNGKTIKESVSKYFGDKICCNKELEDIAGKHPVELAYALAIINADVNNSVTPPWVLKQYPFTASIIYRLLNEPCIEGCEYCKNKLDAHVALKEFFGYDSFRTFDGEPLQEKAAKAAIDGKSLLVVFPTGGGKSLTFQLPALVCARNFNGLTVVISPLQSLMKDQVDNLEKIGITAAVTINGLLDPIERANAIERLEDGSANILYIAPESLRSKTIERILLNRTVVRFVIDEAHCFSSWGHDFRVDYLYIGEFIRNLGEKKNRENPIPVSCFTATAKQKVMEDICAYFNENLSLELEIFRSDSKRKNLEFKVFKRKDVKEKYELLRELLQIRDCPAIVYVSRTKRAYEIAKKLTEDGYPALPYHGQMESGEKTENQEAFMSGDARIMVATSAFGMGVDKKDVGMVIHYNISDSLENYVQEAGRAGRDERIDADCYVIFCEEDLDNHFTMLNQTRITSKEINQIWKAVKQISGQRTRFSKSALEIASQAGWDETIKELDTRVKTAIAALESSGYLKRGQNMPRVYADGILYDSVIDAIARLESSKLFTPKKKEMAKRILSRIFTERSTSGKDNPMARVDCIADHLGIKIEQVIDIVQLLREEKILADSKDLYVFLPKKESKGKIKENIRTLFLLEDCILDFLTDGQVLLNLKDINEKAEILNIKNVSIPLIRRILNYWAIKKWIEYKPHPASSKTSVKPSEDKDKLQNRIRKNRFVVKFVYEYLVELVKDNEEEKAVGFSVLELKLAYEKLQALDKEKIKSKNIEDALLYLSKTDNLKIEGGFLVIYQTMSIERLEKDNRIQYKLENYNNLEEYYKSKTQQIHIVGEYARKMTEDYVKALQFVDDYFQLEYGSFIRKYFEGEKEIELKRNMTPEKFKRVFGELSPTQLEIIKDHNAPCILVNAGPGSGKTRVLVHKLASLIMLEETRLEQLLMLTFSRAAATEFKKRLIGIAGKAAYYVGIKTFHSFCFDILGRVGTVEKSSEIIKEAIERIRNDEVEQKTIAKHVLVIDEAQDINEEEYRLICEIIKHNESIRMVLVGDDDQNIYAFRGSDSQYMQKLTKMFDSSNVHELVTNYRSKANLIEATNRFAGTIGNRMKKTPIQPNSMEQGKIRLIKYKTPNILTAITDDILKQELKGTMGILTRTNEEADKIAGLLNYNGCDAKLIQSNEGFSMYDLKEIRIFLSYFDMEREYSKVSKEDWDEAKRRLKVDLSESINYRIIDKLIKNYEMQNPYHKYLSDLEEYIRESELEHFMDPGMYSVIVSTMHKAKGREFDNVFILLGDYIPYNDEEKRLLYVSMTRAKTNLSIYTQTDCLDYIKAEGMEKIGDNREYPPPKTLSIQLTHKDVVLDSFIYKQEEISKLIPGQEILVNAQGCMNKEGKRIIRYSKSFAGKIESFKRSGYNPVKGKAQFVLYWKKSYEANEEQRDIKEKIDEKEYLIALPNIWFELEQGRPE